MSTIDGGHYQHSPSAIRAGKPDGHDATVFVHTLGIYFVYGFHILRVQGCPDQIQRNGYIHTL